MSSYISMEIDIGSCEARKNLYYSLFVSRKEILQMPRELLLILKLWESDYLLHFSC